MYNKKAAVLVYVLFLVTLSMIFASVVLNNFAFLSNYVKYLDVESKILSNLRYEGKIAVNFNRDLNSNGSGFIDNISCPTNFTMSGTSNSGTISSFLVNSGSIYCSGSYLTNDLKLYFNTGFTDFVEAEYDSYMAQISSGSGVFFDSDNTNIDFSFTSYLSGDLIDDDFNSDNYRPNSSGSTDYPNSYFDDDDLARKMIFGYVPPNIGLKKVLWNTPKTMDIINDNLNNTGATNINIGNVSEGYLYFDIDNAFDIRLVEFDKSKYEATNELIITNSFTGSETSGIIGYLADDMTFDETLSLSDTKIFDFRDNMYSIFLRSTGSGTLLYKIRSEEKDTNKNIYINPIDDSGTGVIRYMGNEILINEEGRFLSKEMELLFEK